MSPTVRKILKACIFLYRCPWAVPSSKWNSARAYHSVQRRCGWWSAGCSVWTWGTTNVWGVPEGWRSRLYVSIPVEKLPNSRIWMQVRLKNTFVCCLSRLAKYWLPGKTQVGKPGFSQAGQYCQKWQYWAILGNKIFSPSFHYEIL